MARFQRPIVAAFLIVTVVGCTKFKVLDSGSPSQLMQISGVVQLGPVKKSNVKAYCLEADGQRAASPMGAAVSDSEGKFTIVLSPHTNCSILLSSLGGEYEEESSGTAVVLSSSDEVRSIVKLGDTASNEISVSVTPISDMAVARFESIRNYLDNAGSGSNSHSDLDKIIERAKEEVRSSVGLPAGLDITSVLPSPPDRPDFDSDSESNQLAVVIAGLSEMANNKGKNSHQLTKDLASDIADGAIDDSTWLDLPSHINTWTSGTRNSGGFQPPASIIPVLVPTIDGNKFPLPVSETEDVRTVPFRAVIIPANVSNSLGCLGPFKVHLYSITNELSPAVNGLQFGINAVNSAGVTLPAFRTLADCSNATSAASSLGISAGASSLDSLFIRIGSSQPSIVNISLIPQVSTVSSSTFTFIPPPPPAAELHVVSIYEAENSSTGWTTDSAGNLVQPTHWATPATVTIQDGSSPIVLALVSYEGVNWNIQGATYRIQKVISHGYYNQTVAGVDASKVELNSYESQNSWIYNLVNESPYEPTSDRFKILAVHLKERTGANITSMQGAYSKNSFVIGDGLNLPPPLPALTLNPMWIYGSAWGSEDLLEVSDRSAMAEVLACVNTSTKLHPTLKVSVVLEHITTNNDDIAPFSTVVTIVTGSNESCFKIPIKTDTAIEGTETFKLKFSIIEGSGFVIGDLLGYLTD